MSTGHGGARPGAGRKPKRERYERQWTAFEDCAANDLPQRYAAMTLLADGGFEEVEEEYLPAGLVFVGTGEWATLAFPELPPEQLVCVKQKKRVAAPDRKANEYLVDRILGRPTQHTEWTGEDGAPIALRLSDDERLAGVTALAERARARRAGLLVDGEPGELSP